MGWDIKVWHEEWEGRTRLCLEANPAVPDDVVAVLASSYWLEEVQYTDAEWDGVDIETGGTDGPGSKLQG